MFEKLWEMIKRRKEAVLWVVVFLALLIAALIVGVKGNIPGIVLSFLSSVALVFAVTRHWHEARKFLLLLGASVVVFLIFIWLYNILYGLGSMIVGVTETSHVPEFLRVVFFYIIVFLCPVCWVVGVAGIIMSFVQKRGTDLEQMSEEQDRR